MNINKSNLLLLHPLNKWMKKKKWSWFPHQIETFNHVRTGSDVVVFAPTGAGKTLTGFINPIDDLRKLKKLRFINKFPLKKKYDSVVIAVAHNKFKKIPFFKIKKLIKKSRLVIPLIFP